jgi:sulfate adenylyltransferase subunit 1 (EFTu-like GTPase family)
MVQLSYNIQHAQNLDHFKEAYEEFSSQLQNKDLEFIPRYSNRQSAVVWDPVNDKWYIAYHGARRIQGSDKEGV